MSTATKAQHTEGPWSHPERFDIRDLPVVDHAELIRGQESDWIAIATTDGRISQAAMQANARLIAAAPNLLDACKVVLQELDDRYDVSQDGETSKEYPFNGAGACMFALREAIAKAEGQ